MPTHLDPEIQNTLTGFWCYGQNGLTPEILAQLVYDILPAETVRDWIELVRYLPPGMLRPADPPAAHWHARLADYCEKNQSHCRYALQWLVQHHLSAGHHEQAAAWLSNFEYLYRRLQLGSSQARQIWQELLQLDPVARPKEWESFWRGGQFLVDPSPLRQGPNPEPHLTFLALAEAYAEGSSISDQATRWLERVGPDKHWLRPRFRPRRAYGHPLLLELPLAEREWIARLLFSPDGRRLLSVTSSGQAHAFEAHSGRDLGPLELAQADYQWLPGGLLALSKSTLYVLDPDTFEVRQTQQLPPGSWGRRFAAAGSRLVTSNGEREVLVWDWREQRALTILPPPERGLHELYLSQDGRRVTVLSESEAHGCDLDESGQPRRYHRNPMRPWSDVWGPGLQVVGGKLQLDGRAVLAEHVDEIWEWCRQDEWALLWDHGSWSLWSLTGMRRLACFGWPVPDDKVYRDSKQRYVASKTKGILGRSECVLLDHRRERALTWKLGSSSAQIVAVADQQVVAELTGQRDALVHGAISSDGRRAATVTKAGNLRIWDTHNGKCLRLLKGRAVCAALSRDGSLALSGDAEGQVRLWNLSRGHCLTILEGHSQPIEWLAFGQDNLMISGDCERFQIWSAERQLLAQIGRPPRLYARDVSPCGRFLYAEKIGNERWGAALVYDLDQGRVVSQLPCASSKPSGSCFSSDASLLAVANQEGEFHQSCSLRIWRGEQLLESYRLPLAYNALAFNDTHMAASSQGQQIRIWERGLPSPPGHDAAILALESDRQHLISGSIDKTAMIWSLDSGECLHRLAPGDRWVHWVGLNGPFAFCAHDQDRTLWDLERQQAIPGGPFPDAVNSRRQILSLDGKHLIWWSHGGQKPVRLGPHPPAVHCCAFSPDGLRAISATARGSLKLWNLASQRCLKSWQTPLSQLKNLRWIEPEVVILHSQDGRSWAWDLEHGTGSRLEADEQDGEPLGLEFGTGWNGQPLKVSGRQLQPAGPTSLGHATHEPTDSSQEGSSLANHRPPDSGPFLASWWFPIQRALRHDSNRIVAAQDTGEIHFLELLPPGPVGSRAAAPRQTSPRSVRPRQSGLQRTPLDRLGPCQRVLLTASGGRSDLVAAVPLLHALAQQGKEVFLAAPLSGRKQSEGYREIPPKGKSFENRLAALVEKPLYGFAPAGTLPRLEVYRDLVRHLSCDALVLVEAGVETLLRGDEPSLGTAADDLVSLAAAAQLELPVKMLANLGMGIDLSKGLCHAYSLEAIADLIGSGGYWGSFSLLPGRPEFALMLEAARLLAPGHPVHNLMRGLAGEFGGDLYLNPLMNQYWFFELDRVAARCKVLEWLEDKITAMDVHRSLTNYLTVQQPRPWIEISC